MPSPSPTPAANARDVIVVGGGVAGLFCATALADAGLRVTVLEARGAAGGRARSWPDAATGVDVDIGPHVVSSEHRNFLHMLQRLGTADRIAWQGQPMISLLDAREVLDVANVRWTPPLHGLPNLPVALRRLGLGDALSHWRLAWHAARTSERGLRALDARDAYGWLRASGVSERAIDWFWRSAMLALLNVPLEQCSAAAAMRIFRLMLGRSGYHFGFPKVGLSDLYVPAATAAITARGGEVLRGAVVRRLRIEGGVVRGVQLRDGRALQAPRCVLALAPWDAAALLARTGEPALAALQRAARGFLGAPYTSTMLWFDRRIVPHRFWARVWNPEDLNTDFYDLANIRPGLAQGGSLIAVNAIGPNARLHWSDAQVLERTHAELAEIAPALRDARLLHTRIHRIRAAIPQPRPGSEVQRPGTLTPVTGLLLAGDWTDTAVPASMESAARSALLAADAITGSTLAIPAPETRGLVALLRARD